MGKGKRPNWFMGKGKPAKPAANNWLPNQWLPNQWLPNQWPANQWLAKRYLEQQYPGRLLRAPAAANTALVPQVCLEQGGSNHGFPESPLGHPWTGMPCRIAAPYRCPPQVRHNPRISLELVRTFRTQAPANHRTTTRIQFKPDTLIASYREISHRKSAGHAQAKQRLPK